MRHLPKLVPGALTAAALAEPAAGQAAGPPPLRWRRMAWVTWRQHRAALAGVAALLGAWALYLWLSGVGLHHAYAAAIACQPATSPACQEIISDFNYSYGDPALHTAGILHAVPALIGAFVGAPVLARELETGTFRYAWTQDFGRWRWTLAKLVPLAIAVTAAAGVFSLLFSWYYQPLLAEGFQSPFAPEVFDLRGVAFAAWTLAAFAIGALAGTLIRRVVPAIVATLAVYTGLALTAGLYLRHQYAVPLLTSNLNVPGSAWVMNQWWTTGGRYAFTGPPSNDLLTHLCPRPGAVVKPPPTAPAQCLTQHGYTQWTTYQPASRFWPFQWIESGWLLALSLLLIATTIWLIRRRAT